MSDTSMAQVESTLPDNDRIVAALQAAGVEFQRFWPSKERQIWSTAGSQDVGKLCAGVRLLLSEKQDDAPASAASSDAVEDVMRLVRRYGKLCEENRREDATAQSLRLRAVLTKLFTKAGAA